MLLARAARVDERWPLVAGAYCQVKPLHDSEGFFRRLRETAAAIPPEWFRQAVEEALVGELYELIGKARNARVRGEERMVMAGRLSSPDAVTAVLEGFWAGLTGWARRHGYRIDSPQAIPF